MEHDVKLANLRELKTKAELNALHSKINPHFLYNSLNSIAGLAKTDADKTEHMALLLSKLFRYSINKEQSDWSTLAEELEMVTIYLEIEKVRFDDRLSFTIDLPEELSDIKIPRFMIQPLVENAIKHGISKLVSKGEVGISVRKAVQGIEISVSDNGPDFPSELNTGFGLQGIYDKLEILYPNRFELSFLNSPNKQINIKLW
jgi:LytS/YehU family sensor histidine kinase